ncbi:hypothetical protein [Nonomuraea gerenzanensis]|uniref:Uncharacterized protein n=1 Tax=Nonomuraea gerenzanensis TaxID=93944 RepID=A0A1M4ECY7_9ACTN|nr:hypothetical protein [Nonomuraea gerenzanensis]UBU18599.1 hypothetical protein LCN96_27325 [Nonomuraea gerenzanensis]SBO96443.1 hypothetical protein BN4615_P5959 [Nonomuraea gerenzanensis]
MRYVVGAVLVVWVVVRVAQWIWARVVEPASVIAAVAVPVLGVLAALVAVVAVVRMRPARVRRVSPPAASWVTDVPPQDHAEGGGRPPAPRASGLPGRCSAPPPPYGDRPAAPEPSDDRAFVLELLTQQPARPDPTPQPAGLPRAILQPTGRAPVVDAPLQPGVPSEPVERAPSRTVPITIVLEPHRALHETGRAGAPIDRLQVTDTPHVILSPARDISWTADYRIKRVEIDVDSLAEHLTGTARDALRDLVIDPGDEAANRRFRDALARVHEEPEPGGRRDYEGRPCLDVTTVGCDFVVERPEHDVTAHTRHVIASGEISLAGLLLEHAELVRGFALCLSPHADPADRQEFARELARVIERMSPVELVQATCFPDRAAEIEVAESELAVRGAAIAAVGDDFRIHEKLRAELSRLELAALAELTLRDLGMRPSEVAELPRPEEEQEPARGPAEEPCLPEEPHREPAEEEELVADPFDRLWPF